MRKGTKSEIIMMIVMFIVSTSLFWDIIKIFKPEIATQSGFLAGLFKLSIATSTTTLTIVLGSSGKNNIKVDGAKVVGDANYVITLTIEAGSHTITKADSAYLFYLSVE